MCDRTPRVRFEEGELNYSTTRLTYDQIEAKEGRSIGYKSHADILTNLGREMKVDLATAEVMKLDAILNVLQDNNVYVTTLGSTISAACSWHEASCARSSQQGVSIFGCPNRLQCGNLQF